jgi:ribonuclease-3
MTGSDNTRLEQRLAYQFSKRELLERALTHSSLVPEMRIQPGDGARADAPKSDNERFEFLGDAVLELLASEYLVEKFADWSEGRLSKARARIVNARTLEAAARRLELGEHLLLGRGEEKTGGREKAALLADAFEAVLGAVYLDGGLTAARNVLQKVLFDSVELDADEAAADSKSALQEHLQARGEGPAEYKLARESGPDHRKTFAIEVLVKGGRLGEGQGRTKKEAEQAAAGNALERLRQTELKES